MDLDIAIQKHAEWKMKFRTAIVRQDTMDATTIGKDNCCDLGKWLHGEGKNRHGALRSHAECVRNHAAFHREAAKVALAINARKYDAAIKMIDGGTGYANASNEIAGAIIRLKKEARL